MLSEQRRRVIGAITAALATIAVYVVVLYGFARWIWPVLPDWALLLAFLAIAVALIGSPIMALRYAGSVRTAVRRTRREPGRPPSDD